MFKISSSIIAANFSNLEKEISKIEKYVDYLHIDIMDGHFVPNITLGPDIAKDISTITTKPLDIHLMISEPTKYIDKFLELNPEYITVHYEAMTDKIFNEILDKISKKNGQNKNKEKKIKLGIAISPDTPYEVVTKYMENIDLILVMSVYPGFYGQEFIEDVTYKIERLRELIDDNDYEVEIEVDGGINNKTAQKVKGADILVAGSYIFKAQSPKKNIELLKQ